MPTPMRYYEESLAAAIAGNHMMWNPDADGVMAELKLIDRVLAGVGVA